MMKKYAIAVIAFALGTSLSCEAQVLLRHGAELDFGWGDAGSVVTPYVTFSSAMTAPYVGNQITMVRIGVMEKGTNVYVYIKHSPDDAQPLYRQKVESLEPGWNEITLDTPFTITSGEDFTVGYKAQFSEASGVGCSNEIYPEADRIYYNSRNSWASTGKSLCIQAVAEGEKMPQNLMLIGKIPNTTAFGFSTDIEFRMPVRNVGTNLINNFTISGECDGNVVIEKDFTSEIPVNSTDTVALSMPVEGFGNHSVALTISKVNGIPLSYDGYSRAEAIVTLRDEAYRKRVVCEEFTGTWCGNCPRGMVGMEMMREKHPDEFIAIAVHGAQFDPMEIDAESPWSYKPYIDSCTGAPYCNVNRRFSGDPYNDIERIYALEVASECHYAYELESNWTADGSAIEVNSTFWADSDLDASGLRIAYTVTEDNVTGYPQVNYYANGEHGEMGGWENKANPAMDAVFNDVARAIYGGYSGEDLGLRQITAESRQFHKATIPLPETVADKANVKVVGQLIDSASGYILNAMEVKPSNGAGIKGIAENHTFKVNADGDILEIYAPGYESVKIFNLNGLCILHAPLIDGVASMPKPASGIYVVTADGKAISKLVIR